MTAPEFDLVEDDTGSVKYFLSVRTLALRSSVRLPLRLHGALVPLFLIPEGWL
jgi:hypothetical protein